MAYISTQQVAEIRNELKSLFPKTKFSIKREHYSGVRIAILKSNINFNVEYKTINELYIAENYAGDQQELLMKIYEVAERGTNYYETGDYGTQPSHYVWMQIGEINKPFEHKN